MKVLGGKYLRKPFRNHENQVGLDTVNNKFKDCVNHTSSTCLM